MATQYTSILKLALPTEGELSGTWGDVVNDNITSMVEEAIAGRAVIDSWTANGHTLTTADGTTAEARCAMLEFTDTNTDLTGNAEVICPTASKIYIAKNATGAGYSVTVKTSAGTGIAVPDGETMFLFCDGTNVVEAITSVKTLKIADGVQVNTILDEDNMASDSATALATQQSIKAYVDAQVTAQDLDIAGDSGTGAIDLDSQLLTVAGTANEIETAASGQTITVGLPSVVIVTTSVTTPTVQATNINANDGSTSATIADSTGVMTIASSVLTTTDINGGTIDNSTIATSNITVGAGKTLDVSAGTLTLANDQISGDKIQGGTIGSTTITTLASTTGNITTVNATTVDTTNIEVTNVKAKDGTASATIADSTGVMTIASSVLTTTDINGGTIDGVTIGGASAGAITGTTITGTSFVTSGNMTFGDSDKAIFGAGNDLQIYHDGSNSYIDESAGVGNLIIKGANVQFRTPTSEIYLALVNNAAVTAYYDNAAKLATTATGIDVTGTVTADGLTVDGDININSALPKIQFTDTTGSQQSRLILNDDEIQLDNQSTGGIRLRTDNFKSRFLIAFNGDISFYEDTGTTPKFHWDAADESLGIGTTSPLSALDVSNSFITVSKGAATTGRIGASDYIVGGTDNDFVVQSSGTGVTRFVQTSTERMRITSAGSVNIGGTNGAAKFEVNNAVSTTGSLTDSTINLATTAVTGRKVNIGFGLPGGVGNTNAATIGFDVINGAGALQGDLFFSTRGSTADSVPTERMRIDSSGNVGIGTSLITSGFKMEVIGDARFGDVYNDDAVELGWSDGSSAGFVQVYDRGASAFRNLILNNAVTIDSSGNLGLGNTPSATSASGYTSFELGANAGTGLTGNNGDLYLTENAYVNGGAWKYAASSIVSAMYNLGSGVHRWYTAAAGTAGNAITWTQAMTLDATGNLLVGSTTSSLTSGDGFVFTPDANVAGAKTGYSTDTQTCWNMYSSGAAAYRFYVGWGGTVFATNTTISAISDQRLKENIQDLDAGLDKIMALKPRQFDWKEGKGKNVKGDRGFIAQEFEQVFPDLIDEWKDPAPEGEDPYKSVRADLIPVLVKAIQEQQAIIDSLKSRLDAAGL
jgi:hypothetical protein